LSVLTVHFFVYSQTSSEDEFPLQLENIQISHCIYINNNNNNANTHIKHYTAFDFETFIKVFAKHYAIKDETT